VIVIRGNTGFNTLIPVFKYSILTVSFLLLTTSPTNSHDFKLAKHFAKNIFKPSILNAPQRQNDNVYPLLTPRFNKMSLRTISNKSFSFAISNTMVPARSFTTTSYKGLYSSRCPVEASIKTPKEMIKQSPITKALYEPSGHPIISEKPLGTYLKTSGTPPRSTTLPSRMGEVYARHMNSSSTSQFPTGWSDKPLNPGDMFYYDLSVLYGTEFEDLNPISASEVGEDCGEWLLFGAADGTHYLCHDPSLDLRLITQPKKLDDILAALKGTHKGVLKTEEVAPEHVEEECASKFVCS